MKKVLIHARTAKIADYAFWMIAILLAAWADWRVACAILAFDIMRVFEDLGRPTAKIRIGNIVIRAEVVEVIPTEKPKASGKVEERPLAMNDKPTDGKGTKA